MNTENKSNNKIEYLRYIYIPLILGLIGLIPFVFNRIDKMFDNPIQPKFSIIKGYAISSSKSYILFTPKNKTAKVKKNLDLKINNIILYGICVLDSKSPKIQWRFSIDSVDKIILMNKFQTGENEIHIGFSENEQWDSHSLFIDDLADFLSSDQNEKPTKSVTIDTEKEPNSNSRPNTKKPLNPKKQKAQIIETSKLKPIDTPYYEATGTCIINMENTKNKEKAILMAKKCASIIAEAELLKMIKGAEITEKVKITNMELDNQEISSKLDGRIMGAYQFGEAKIKENSVEVTYRLNKNK